MPHLLRKLTILVLAIALLPLPQALANHEIPITDQETIKFSVFTRETCGHCQELEAFLEEDFGERVPGVQAKLYHLEEDYSSGLFKDFCDENGLARATPTILIGNKIIQGFQSAETTGEYLIELALELGESSFFENYEKNDDLEGSEEVIVHLPLLGSVDLKDYSLRHALHNLR